MIFKTLQKNVAGITLVEVLVGVSILTIVGIFIGVSVSHFALARNNILHDTKKMYLAEEGYEIVRILRDGNWSNISSLGAGNIYYLGVATTTLAITSVPEIIDERYLRLFFVEPVYRNSTGGIVSVGDAGAVLDNNSRQVSVQVGDDVSTTTVKALLVNLPTS